MSSKGKLVRDRIPEIIAANGGNPVIHVLNESDYISALNAKLKEELAEWQASGDAEELVDLIEIAIALAATQGISASNLETLRQAKAESRGGFEKRLWLDSGT